MDTLPSGTILVRNPAGVGGEDSGGSDDAVPEATRIIEPDLRLGTADGDGPELFGQVRDIEADALGRIYVLDTQAKEIRVFGSDGSHVRPAGRTVRLAPAAESVAQENGQVRQSLPAQSLQSIMVMYAQILMMHAQNRGRSAPRLRRFTHSAVGPGVCDRHPQTGVVQ